MDCLDEFIHKMPERGYEHPVEITEDSPVVCSVCGSDMFLDRVENGTYYYVCTNKTCGKVEIRP